MPRISGQEGHKKATWQEIQNLIMENLFDPSPSEEEIVRQQIKDLIEEAKKDVRKDDKRESN